MEKQGVSLSYWESLMVIEELKGWYNIDLDLGEGIISSSTIEVWIKSICSRQHSLENSGLHSSKHSEKLIEKGEVQR